MANDYMCVCVSSESHPPCSVIAPHTSRQITKPSLTCIRGVALLISYEGAHDGVDGVAPATFSRVAVEEVQAELRVLPVTQRRRRMVKLEREVICVVWRLMNIAKEVVVDVYTILTQVSSGRGVGEAAPREPGVPSGTSPQG